MQYDDALMRVIDKSRRRLNDKHMLSYDSNHEVRLLARALSQLPSSE
jgi:hypothetical protein